jgi:hypothetical protein
MSNPRQLVKALLMKTEARGSTFAEEQSAKTTARGIAAKHGIDIKAVQAEIDDPNFGASPTTVMRRAVRDGKTDPFDDIVRAWAKARATGAKKSAAQQRAWDERKKKEVQYKTVREMAEHYIMSSAMPYEKIAGFVCDRFPEAKTSKASVAWYASKLRREGKAVPKRRRT